jgi:fructose-1,6-bisphosphatase/inositol monophosphatase family enzyme
MWLYYHIRRPLAKFDQWLKVWERNRWKRLEARYLPPLRKWYYLTFRVSSKLYPSRLDLFSWALQAGGVIRKEFGKTLLADWKEKDKTPVTEIDRAINQLYIRKTKSRFKHVMVIGEEGYSRFGDSEVSSISLVTDEWDGTIPGMLGVVVTSTVASVLVNGVVMATIIHDPILKRTWFAEKGKGAFTWKGGRLQWFRMWLAEKGLAFLWKDRGLGRRLQVSDKPLENSINSLMWWAGSVGNLDEVRPQLDAIPGAHWHNFDAVAISGPLIAEGRMVSSTFGGTNPRETMAMERLVVEAGGYATDLFGGDLVYEEDPENPFVELRPIRGHIITNTYANWRRIRAMVARANMADEKRELVRAAANRFGL